MGEELSTAADLLNNLNGSVEIKDGSIIINDPSGEGLPAVIQAAPLAIIKINGEAIALSRPVRSSDKVEIIPKDEVIPGSVTVELTEGGLLAQIRVSPRIAVKRTLKDTPSTQELILEYNEEDIQSREITVADVEAALQAKDVVFGIDIALIVRAVNDASSKLETVARGEEVKNGRNGYVELFFEPGIKVSSYDEADLSKVDYKEKIIIPSVVEGDVMAAIHAPIPGTPGRLVTGHIIEPPPVREIQVYCKEGCILTEKGDFVKAERSGRPFVEGKYKEIFKVIPVFIHNGDVDLKSGNLRFRGELKVTGDILEGMTVASDGNLEISGNTAGAQIISGENVVFRKNLINSRVTAGIIKDFYKKFFPFIQELEAISLALAEGIIQLEESMTERGAKIDDRKVSYLVKLLVERKFETLPLLAGKILQVLQEKKFHASSFPEDAIKEAAGFFTDKEFSGIQGKAHLGRIVSSLTSAKLFVEQAQEIEGNIIASYIQNSTLICSGDITVKGTGSFNSTFTAGGNIHIEGVFRGGGIKARGDAFLGEAGSPGLLLKQGTIILSTDSVARFRKIYENVQIFFGKRSYKFEKNASMVKVYYSAEEDSIRIVGI